jgi:hypothetical protein
MTVSLETIHGRQLMLKSSKSNLLLFLIVGFSFLYRVFLMLWTNYPPSADIGLHNSVIYSITHSGTVNFFWNSYQMGQGVSVTFPGYHIFVSYIITVASIPETVAHALAASLFSALIVAVAFLITRKVWGTTAALIVAFFVAFSRFDIEMLMWGGYPNVAALMLIPLTFYLFLEKDRFSFPTFVAATSLLSAAIFLTHNLSAVIFVTITFMVFVVETVFSKQFGVKRTYFLAWLLPLAVGAVIISPFLLQALPLFVGSSAVTTSATEVQLALMSSQTLTVDFVLPLLIYVVLIFLLSKKYQGKILSVPALLLSVWILVPAICTQAYLVGVYTDYNRFRYFVYLPVFVTFGLAIEFVSDLAAKAAKFVGCKINSLPQIGAELKKKLSAVGRVFSHKRIYVLIATILTIYSVLTVSMFVLPTQAVAIHDFYEFTDDPSFNALQWIKNYTPADAVCVGDGVYGWWISGFAQRQTLSASKLETLILAREIEPAKNALNLMDTDYVLDNGLIQVWEDGSYVSRDNPMFLAKLNDSYTPYPLFNFNSSDTTVSYSDANYTLTVAFAQLPLQEMHIENTSSYATVTATRGNDAFNMTQQTTVYQGVKYANMTITLETTRPNVSFDAAKLTMHTDNGQLLEGENTAALIVGQKGLGCQLIFEGNQPRIENSNTPILQYDLSGKTSGEIEVWVGVFQVSNITQTDNILNAMTSNIHSYRDKVSDLPLDVFDYQKFLVDWNVSYVVCRGSERTPRFSNDPVFSVAFANNAVTIYKVQHR